MNTVLNIDSSAVTQFTKTLETLHRSALPVAIRQTLNDGAFDVKTNTMPDEADIFIHRRPTFFKANSKVETAKGFEVDAMRATVGFVENSGTQQQAVQDLKMQDEGGSISGRTYIPVDTARVGGSYSRMVRSADRIKPVKEDIIDSKDIDGISRAQKFTKAALKAGKGGVVITNMSNKKGNLMAVRIKNISKNGNKTTIKTTPLYSVKEGRKVHPKATHFMRLASLESAGKLEEFYIKNAEKQIARLAK